ncbi:MAG: PAC2 family protein [Acidimicrobiales bacterium]|nr:PAC2 family protein [Acidimicrobiales bacterium]
MSELFELRSRPDVDAPVLVMCLDGWIDAGLAATNALGTVLEVLDTETVAVFDADRLLDHRSRRPIMHLDDGVNTGLTWPSIELRLAVDLDGNDVLFLVGAEPDHVWQAFSRAVVDLALEFDCRMVLGLGAYPAPTPHTRPTRLVSTSADPERVRQVGVTHGRIDVPAGVHAAIEHQCHEVGLPAIGLWAQIPHYAAAMPYPAGAVALVEGLWTVGGLRFRMGSLREDAATTHERLESLVANSDEHVQMVQQLEAHVDAIESVTDGPLPSGDDLAAEVERFLRDQ